MLLIFKLAFSESLDELINIAKKNNPAIKKFEKEIEVLKQKSRTAGRLPNPSISFNIRDKGSFTIFQYIPWYEKLKLQREMEKKRYEAQLIVYQQEKSRIFTQIKELGLRTWLNRERIKLNTQLISIIDGVLQGDISPSDKNKLTILKIDLLLENKDLELSTLTLLSELKVLLNSDFKDVEIERVDIPDLKEEEVRERIKTVGLAIKQIDKQIERDRLSYKLAKEIYIPDFGVSITYKVREKFDDAISAGVNLYVNVPIWRRLNQEQIVLEQKLQLISSQEKRIIVINQTLWSADKFIQEYKISKEKLDILKKNYDLYRYDMELTTNRYLKKESDINSIIYSISRLKEAHSRLLQETFSVNVSYLRIQELLGEVE